MIPVLFTALVAVQAQQAYESQPLPPPAKEGYTWALHPVPMELKSPDGVVKIEIWYQPYIRETYVSQVKRHTNEAGAVVLALGGLYAAISRFIPKRKPSPSEEQK